MLNNETVDKVIGLAESNFTIQKIAKFVGISSSSVQNIFQNKLPTEQYEQRRTRMEALRQKKSLQGLEKAGRLGSKPERAFHRLLSLMLRTEVRHHDLDLLPPYEIDITVPAARIAVMWDGIGHFKPIFGRAMLKKVRYRDAWKRRALVKMGWTPFIVEDLNSRMRTTFLEEQALRLTALLESKELEHLVRRF